MSVPTMMPAPAQAPRNASTQRADSAGRAESAQKFDSQVKEQVSSSQQDEQGRKPAQKPDESSVGTTTSESTPAAESATKTTDNAGSTQTDEAAAEAALHAFGFLLAQETAAATAQVPAETTPIFDELAALVQEATGEPVLTEAEPIQQLPPAELPVAAEGQSETSALADAALTAPEIAVVVEGAETAPLATTTTVAASTPQPHTPQVVAPESQATQPVAVKQAPSAQQQTPQEGGSQQAPQQNVAQVGAVTNSTATEQSTTQFALPVQAPATTEAAPAARPVHLTSASTPAGMLEQMRGPIGRLATALPGEHTFTVNVTPENLGPVTVRAHISSEGVRVELIGATDSARDSLRVILTDLKRDLQSTGLNAQLNLSDETGTGAQEFGSQEFGAQGNQQRSNSVNATQVALDQAELAPDQQPTDDALGVDILA